MHEATVAQSILNIACTKLRQTPAAESVLAIRVRIGEFRNVEVDSLLFAFDNLKALFHGCSDCRLEVETVAASALCRAHDHSYRPDFAHSFRCTTCDSGIGKMICGEELDVTGITLETTVNEELNEYARVGR